jgi:hypothetical protein
VQSEYVYTPAKDKTTKKLPSNVVFLTGPLELIPLLRNKLLNEIPQSPVKIADSKNNGNAQMLGFLNLSHSTSCLQMLP